MSHNECDKECEKATALLHQQRQSRMLPLPNFDSQISQRQSNLAKSLTKKR